MSHVYHDALPGFDPGNILHDGCDTCEDRAAGLDGLCHLDHNNFRQAWADMLAGMWSDGEGLDRNVSACDRRLMRMLYAVAVLLERHANAHPRTVLQAIDSQVAETEAKLAEMFGRQP